MCLCGLVGMVLAAGPAMAQSADVNARLKRIENDVDTLNRAVYKGETPPPLSQEANEASALVQTRLSQIENDLRNLTGKVEEQTYANQQLQQKVDMLEESARMRIEAIEAKLQGGAAVPVQQPGVVSGGAASAGQDNVPPSPVPVDPSVEINQPQLGAVSGGMDAASLYEQGFAEIKAENYAAAEATFNKFIADYPNHALAPNALYWLGETFYVRKDYNKASRVFAESYQKYPQGPKGADNLLKLGMSLAGKGEKDSACVALKQLKKEYPQGPAPVLNRGDQEMATLGC